MNTVTREYIRVNTKKVGVPRGGMTRELVTPHHVATRGRQLEDCEESLRVQEDYEGSMEY